MANYTDKTGMENVFGMQNINRWADLENNEDVNFIKRRITWAAELSTEHINGRLKNGKYSVPFTAIPKIIVHASSLLGGMLLYDGRSIGPSESPKDQVARHRKEFNRLINDIQSGRMKLLHPTSGDELSNTCETAPQALTAILEREILGEDFNCLCNYCYCRICICDTLRFQICP